MHEMIYFTSGDRQMESFIDKDCFEKSLLINVLFQNSVLIPDIYYFISHGIENHILKSESESKSLIEAGIEEGIIIPSFRGNATSFNQALAIIRSKEEPNKAIQGVLPTAEVIASRLDLAAEHSKKFSPLITPSYDLGIEFEKQVVSLLSGDKPPIIDKNFTIKQENINEVWEITSRWRQKCIEQAIARTRKAQGKGLRRGEIMNAVGKDIGLPNDYRVDDIKELFAILKNEPMRHFALKVFFRWICEIYNFNNANAFGAIPNFPSYEPITGILTSNFLPDDSRALDLSTIPMIKHLVKLPPIKTLMEIPPSVLLKIRNEFGPPYFAAVRLWQKNPTDRNKQLVINALNAYCRNITKHCKEEIDFSEYTLELICGSFDNPTKKLLLVLTEIPIILVSIYQPWAYPLVALGPLGFCVYRWSTTREKNYEVEIPFKTHFGKSRLDVNLPLQKK